MSVHPAYDPVARQWFTEDGLCAPSLATLQLRLGQHVGIEGYYPHGTPRALLPVYPSFVDAELASVKRVVQARQFSYKWQASPPMTFKPRRTPRGVARQRWTPERLAELERRAEAGETPTQIAGAMGVRETAVRTKCWREGIALRELRFGRLPAAQSGAAV